MAKGQKQPRTEETQSSEAKTHCNVFFVFEREAFQRPGGEEVRTSGFRRRELRCARRNRAVRLRQRSHRHGD